MATKKPLSAAARKKHAQELLAKRIKKVAAIPVPQPSPELAACLKRLAPMERALRASSAFRVSGSTEDSPIGVVTIARWEKKLGGKVDDDFRAFLYHQGPFGLTWQLRRPHAELGSGPIGSFDIVFPFKHPMAKIPGFEQLWLFWRGDRQQWAWRAGAKPQLVFENVNDDSILTPKPSFTAMLAEQIEWYGAKPALFTLGADADAIPVKNGLRDLRAIERLLLG